MGNPDDNRAVRRRRSLPVVVFTVLALSSVVTSAAVGGVIDDQEDRLLHEQARAAGALVSTSFSGITSTLPLLGALAQPGAGGEALFGAVAQGFSRGGGTVGTAVRSDRGFAVQMESGDGPATGTVLTGRLGALVNRAMATDGLVSDVSVDGGKRSLMFAVTLPVRRDVVTYSSFVFDAEQSGANSRTPFSELEGALYIGKRVDPSRLVFATATSLPITGGSIATEMVEVGADEWLLVAKARRPLVGGLAKDLHRLVLAVGLVAALLVCALMATVTRRRAYALAMVDQRTLELREALAERERLEEGQRLARIAAEEANRSKSEFLSRMSHELRTPLNAVLGFAQLLESEQETDEARDSVKQILKGGRHLLDLINEVLDITRVETGNFQLSPEPVLASDVVGDVVELTKPLAAHANIELVRGGTAGCDVHVLADRQRLKQILLNLTANAIKYNRPGGTVAISCEAVGSNLRLKVHDTGPGIRPEHRDLLFTPFERLGAEHTSVEGTGVGLALSRRLAEVMGGALDVESTLGQGSTFWVELPVVEGPVERFERLGRARDVPTPAGVVEHRATVLYIEDNLSNLRLVERIIAGHPDVQLVTAMQGRLGVELAREHRPALVLLDLHLPDIGGDEVLRRLREDPSTASIPVVIVSADATAGQIKRLLAEGARSYLTKPLDVQEVRRLLDELAGAPT